ncbi:MAG: glycosyltransferase family 4 protein [Phycisphaerales bacterium]|nr:glycosyltransferase family 4 protein [Phycisphaerales bacterium]MCB9854161.1 glycosyltransferase family 4 protein [Phycisphaerales bacterium]MCB9864703.1 glycosyltransferase family 4 protein [Phycisphaerales bacterium]
MTPYLGIFTTHPIQYQVQLYRMLSERDDIRVRVYYASDSSLKGEVVPDFNCEIKWDVPLLDGYESIFMKNVAKNPGPTTGFWGMNCPDIPEIMRSEKFDAILTHGYNKWFHLQVLRGAWRCRIPVMMRGDSREGANVRKSGVFEAARDLALRTLYRRVAIGLSVGTYMRRHFARLGMSDRQIVDCPHCVDDQRFEREREAWLPRRASRRAELGIPEDALVLLFSGSLIPRKNPCLLADALGAIPSLDNVWLLMVGDGPLMEEASRRLKAVLGERVVMLGFVNQLDLAQYYTISDVHVFPSRHETWGLVVNEAMIFDMPSIVTDRVGCREDLVIPDKTGYIVPNEDSAALAAAIKRYVDDPSLAARQGLAARELVRRFSSQAAVDGIVEGVRRAAGLA